MTSAVSAAEWLQFFIIVLVLLGTGLKALSHLAFVAKSSAWSTLVSGAQAIVNQIIAVLEVNKAATKATLVQQGVTEMRATFSPEIARLGINYSMIEPFLALLLQRLLAGTPVGLAQILGDVVKMAGPMGAGKDPSPLNWSKHFAREVGAP